jgi:hypothetical protein
MDAGSRAARLGWNRYSLYSPGSMGGGSTVNDNGFANDSAQALGNKRYQVGLSYDLKCL